MTPALSLAAQGPAAGAPGEARLLGCGCMRTRFKAAFLASKKLRTFKNMCVTFLTSRNVFRYQSSRACKMLSMRVFSLNFISMQPRTRQHILRGHTERSASLALHRGTKPGAGSTVVYAMHFLARAEYTVPKAAAVQDFLCATGHGCLVALYIICFSSQNVFR